METLHAKYLYISNLHNNLNAFWGVVQTSITVLRRMFHYLIAVFVQVKFVHRIVYIDK